MLLCEQLRGIERNAADHLKRHAVRNQERSQFPLSAVGVAAHVHTTARATRGHVQHRSEEADFTHAVHHTQPVERSLIGLINETNGELEIGQGMFGTQHTQTCFEAEQNLPRALNRKRQKLNPPRIDGVHLDGAEVNFGHTFDSLLICRPTPHPRAQAEQVWRVAEIIFGVSGALNCEGWRRTKRQHHQTARNQATHPIGVAHGGESRQDLFEGESETIFWNVRHGFPDLELGF